MWTSKSLVTTQVCLPARLIEIAVPFISGCEGAEAQTVSRHELEVPIPSLEPQHLNCRKEKQMLGQTK